VNRFNIGEFSRLSGIPVKTLRFYHEKQLLIPASIEADSGYRNYDHQNLDAARVIVALRKLDFSLAQIATILNDHQDDSDILDYLDQRKSDLAREISHKQGLARTLESIINTERIARKLMQETQHEVTEKTLEPLLVGGIRTEGRYSECGTTFKQLGRGVGMNMKGKAMMLCYDDEYREEDADYECCFPLRKQRKSDGIDVRELVGGRCISLIHVGTYESISRSYERLIEHANQHELELKRPSREVYLKGPGMIFKGNPKKYVTEIQFLVEA